MFKFDSPIDIDLNIFCIMFIVISYTYFVILPLLILVSIFI